MYKSVFAVVIGIAFFVGAAINAFATMNFIQSSVVALGNVTALNAGGSHPEIEFVTRTGERISYPQGGMISGFKVGDRVRVRYRPDDAYRSATVDQFGSLWNAPIILAILGAGFIASGVLQLARHKVRTVED
jgi:hypothetical protein